MTVKRLFALVARSPPPGEAEEAGDHEEAGARLGDHRDAETQPGELELWAEGVGG